MKFILNALVCLLLIIKLRSPLEAAEDILRLTTSLLPLFSNNLCNSQFSSVTPPLAASEPLPVVNVPLVNASLQAPRPAEAKLCVFRALDVGLECVAEHDSTGASAGQISQSGGEHVRVRLTDEVDERRRRRRCRSVGKKRVVKGGNRTGHEAETVWGRFITIRDESGFSKASHCGHEGGQGRMRAFRESRRQSVRG